METLSFTYGVLSIIALLSVIAIIMDVIQGNKHKSQIKFLQQNLDDLTRTMEGLHSEVHQWVDERTLMIDRRIDGEIDRMNLIHEHTITYIDSKLEKVSPNSSSNVIDY
jgi:hypothetical protein